jgi:outer membrane protein assembly factor BamB
MLKALLIRGAMALGVLAAISGCATSGAERSPAPLPMPKAQDSVVPLWRFALGARSGLGFAPVALGASVWAAAEDGTVVRIRRDDGRIEWRVKLDRPLSAGVATDGLTTVVVARDGHVIALDERGGRRWAEPLGVEVVSLPALADGLVLVRSTDQRVFALDAATGRRRWVQPRPNPPLVLRQAGGFAVVPGVGFMGLPGGRLVAVTLAHGGTRWDVAVAQPRGTTDIERIADVVGSPLVIDDQVCAASYQGRIGCFEAETGRAVWSRPFSSAVGFDIDADGLVAPDAEDGVHAWDRMGEPVWQQKALARRVLTAPLFVGERVVWGDGQGYVVWLARRDGQVLAAHRTDGRPIVAAPAASAGVVVVQTSAGGLYAYREAR